MWSDAIVGTPDFQPFAERRTGPSRTVWVVPDAAAALARRYNRGHRRLFWSYAYDRRRANPVRYRTECPHAPGILHGFPVRGSARLVYEMGLPMPGVGGRYLRTRPTRPLRHPVRCVRGSAGLTVRRWRSGIPQEPAFLYMPQKSAELRTPTQKITGWVVASQIPGALSVHAESARLPGWDCLRRGQRSGRFA